ncbi:hypothetical protein D3C75_938110 [compost metagenome]
MESYLWQTVRGSRYCLHWAWQSLGAIVIKHRFQLVLYQSVVLKEVAISNLVGQVQENICIVRIQMDKLNVL